MDGSNADRWVRQLILTAMLLVALALVVTGIALYGPRAPAPPLQSSEDPRDNEYVCKLESGRPVVLSNGRPNLQKEAQ